MSGFFGADTEALREHAEVMRTGAQRLGEIQATLNSSIMGVGWQGSDAETFRTDFSSRVTSLFEQGVSGLDARAAQLDQEAEEQDETSAEGNGGGILDDIFGGIGDFFDNPAVVAASTAVSVGSAAVKSLRGILQARDLRRYQNAINAGRMRAPIRIADQMNTRGLGMLGRVGGRVFGPLGIYSGIQDMIDPPHDGWRGVGDRVAGGLGVIGGAGMTALALGATLNPVGLTVVGVAAAGSALWAAGNAIWDNREAIGDFVGDMGGHLSDALDTAGDVASDIGDGVSDFFGGIF